MSNNKCIHEKRFEAAVKVMRSLPEDGPFVPSEDMMIRFYSYYEQATVGPCNTRKPTGWNSSAKAKWEGWKALGDMSKAQAMKEYVQEIKLILEILPVTEEVAGLLDVLEPFYELVEDETEGEDETITSRSEISDSSDEGTEDDAPEEVKNEENGSSGEGVEDDLELENLADDGGDDNGQKLQSDDSNSELLYSGSVEQSSDEEGSDAAEARLAQPAATRARNQEGPRQNTEDQCVTLDGYPRGAGPTPLVLEMHEPVQFDRGSVRRGRGCRLTGNAVPPCSGTVTSVNVRSEFTKTYMDIQITELLARLQNDMQSILERLNSLENQKRSHVQTSAPQRDPQRVSARKQIYRHQLDVSPISLAFMLVWPFAVHWLVQLYLQRKRSGR
ncbi:acyl-CoA-binding domain-containing protein 5-B isoform X2 [Trichomycterus rosablanca]|uniref:acyl-CoA-binding domain-containing protein 5-B isoform X2 n=1 Tax=Trichomycterus rosablanca TaxID=2290929 RepID=UPI002F35BA75